MTFLVSCTYNNIGNTKMATSLLRLGRFGLLKCLQQDGWGALRTPLTVALCTKAQPPKKPAKKTSSKTSEAPDERASLLAYKTTVAFPARLSSSGFLSQGDALGESKQSGDLITGASAMAVGAASTEPKVESCDVGTSITETATQKDATSPTSGEVKTPKSEDKPKNDDATSSSSSDSDSDSDSDTDSDDEKPEKTKKKEPVFQAEDKAGQKGRKSSAVSEDAASHLKTKAVPEHVQADSVPKEAPEIAKEVTESMSKKVSAPSKAVSSSEEMVDPAPVLCTADSVKPQPGVKPEKQAGVEAKASEVSDAIPKHVTEGTPDVAATPIPEVVRDSAPKTAFGRKVEIKPAPKTTEAVAAAEELVDPAPVSADAEEVRAEPEVAAAPEEAAAAPAPEPEPKPEPFDNTSYKNLQHHNYNVYTFVDMDVEMANQRMPQPSTGRPSPKH